MAQLLGLSAEQVARIRPLISQGRDSEGAALGDAPAADGPTLYNRCRRWWDKGVFDLIFSELSASDAPEPPGAPEPEVLMLDATHIKAHPTASSLNKGGLPPAGLVAPRGA